MTYQNPAELRAACREGWAAPTSGHAAGFTQCNLIAWPEVGAAQPSRQAERRSVGFW